MEQPNLDATPSTDERTNQRRHVSVAGRLTWKDAQGATRCAVVQTRNVSEHGVLVACLSGPPIPLHRLVSFHVDRSAAACPELPTVLRRASVPAAVYRVGPFLRATGAPDTYALRLLVKPDRRRGLAARTATLTQAVRRCSVASAAARPVAAALSAQQPV